MSSMIEYGTVLPRIVLGPRFLSALASVGSAIVAHDQGDLVLVVWDEES